MSVVSHVAIVLSSFVHRRFVLCTSGRLCFVIVAFPGYLHIFLHDQILVLNSDANPNYKYAFGSYKVLYFINDILQ